MNKKEDRLLEHEYDGIQELDNDLPPWWLWLFYISIIFGVVYMIHYHVIGTGDLSAVEYNKEINPNYQEVQDVNQASMSIGYSSPFYQPGIEMTPQLWSAFENYVGPKVEFEKLVMEAMRKADADNLAKLQQTFPEIWTKLTEGGATITPAEKSAIASTAQTKMDLDYERLTDSASLDAGKQIYITNCASCHGPQGQGGIGPNMTDNYYIHGGRINDLMAVIINGVPVKGMISWKGILNDVQMNQVASYMMSLRGTNPPNPKDPQGELVDFTEETATN
jgi:mono/diheme cytochrome c family protein